MRRYVLSALIVLLLLIASCGNSGRGEDAAKGSSLSVVPTDLRDVKLVEENKTSNDLIEAAYANGSIGGGEYAALRLRAVVAPATLPEEYRGEPATRGEDSLAIQIALEHWDEMSAKDQEELRPYTLSPLDPESFWYDANDTFEGAVEQQENTWFASSLKRVYDWFEIIPAVAAVKHPHSSGNAFMISAPKKQFTIVANALKKSHKKFTDMGMPEPDEWILVKLLDKVPGPKGAVVYGFTYMAPFDGKQRCNILLDKHLDEEKLKAITAHELFHCFQLHIPLQISANEWLAESTAVWAEEYVYPKINAEHEYDEEIFPHLNKPFTDTSGLHEYGSYLWWFYVYQRNSKTPYDIRNSLYKRKEVSSQEEVLMKRPAWDSEMKQYALWNVNSGAAKFYEDFDDMPTWTPLPPAYHEGKIRKGKTTSQKIELKPGAIKYYYYTVDDNIDKLRFDLKGVAHLPHTGVQVIYKIDGHEVIRDVSYQDKLVFCRKRPEEKVDSILFIINNADLKKPFSAGIPIETSEKCAPGWRGTVSFTWNAGGDSTMPTFTGEVKSTWSEQGSYISNEELIYDKKNDEFLLKSQTASYSYQYGQYSKFTNQPCGTRYYSQVENVHGGGSKKWQIDEGHPWKSKAPTRLKGNKDGTYKLELDIFPDTISSVEIRTTERTPCLGEGITIPSEGNGGQEVYIDESGIEWPYYNLVLTMSDDKKRLTGTADAFFQLEDRKIPVTMNVEYRYE